MIPRFIKDVCCLFLFLTVIFLTISCGRLGDEENRKALPFEICKETQLPDELKNIIDERKEKEFQFVYENSACRYVAVGFGRQKNEEYAVAVKEFYEGEEVIVLDTILKNTDWEEGKETGEAAVCPYLVIRCELTEKPVVFR